MARLAIRAVRTERPSSTAFCRVPMSPERGVLDVAERIPLHPVEVPTDLPPMGDPSSVRTVRFASGLELDVVPERLDWPDSYSYLRAGRVAPSGAPCFVDDAPSDLHTLWAIGPELAASPGIVARIPADGLADGTLVELWIVGGIFTELSDGRMIEEGAFEPYGTATVRDGFIVVDAGSALPYLSWVGIRRLP